MYWNNYIKQLAQAAYYRVISNRIILCQQSLKTIPNTVNLHYWDSSLTNGPEMPYNLGDVLSSVIVSAMLGKKGLSLQDKVHKSKHLYAVGSILVMGYQNATVWGSGLLHSLSRSETIFHHFPFRKLDVRCVRGPLTRESVMKLGYTCPELYGDPVILMPVFYPRMVSRETDYIIIPHINMEKKYHEQYGGNIVSMMTNDYESVIDKICKAKKVISGSLHGIILAESYGIPAVWLRDRGIINDFKYYDYYYSTKRSQVSFASTIEEALLMEPMKLPDNMKELQEGLIRSFPYDLWESQQGITGDKYYKY